MPSHLESTFQIRGYRSVALDNLFVGLSLPDNDRVAYVMVRDTPHFLFASHMIHGRSIRPIHGYRNYEHYAAINDDVCTQREFINLINTIRDNSYNHRESPILVFRSWRRMFPLNRWDVADGFHRLAILAALGQERLMVGILRRKHNMVVRAWRAATRRHEP